MSSLLIYRQDELDGTPYILAVYPSYTWEELRMRAFRLAYPGNDDMPSYDKDTRAHHTAECACVCN